MKRSLALLTVVLIFSGLLPNALTNAYSVTYVGADNSNAYASSVIQSVAGTLTEKTDAAESSTSNDVSLNKIANSELYVGYSEPFDGISAEVYSSASGGSYSVEYWDGSSWETLVSTNSSSISNNTDGTFQVDWSVPSDWSSKNILMDMDEDGNTNQYSGSYYFVKMVVEGGYSTTPSFNQVAVINYQLKVNVEDQFGDTPSSYTSSYTFDSSDTNDTVYVSKSDGNGQEYYGFYTVVNPADFDYTATVSGFVTESGSFTLTEDQTVLTLDLDYTHKIMAEDASSGDQVNITDAYAGTNDTDCVIYSGDAYCPVPTDEDGNSATVSASGYYTESVSIPNRSSDTTAQQSTTVYLDESSSSTDPDLAVNDLYFSGTKLYAEIENEGDDVSSGDEVYIAVYVDGSREFLDYYSYSYFEAGETGNFSFLSGEFDEGESYEIEVCVDYYDDINEDSESNNCRTETLRMDGGSSSNDPDLTVDDLYFEDDALWADISNEGDEDVSSSDTIYVYVYVDETKEYSGTISYRYFDAGESNSYAFLDGDFETDDSYEIEVCIDPKDDVNEDDEDNNCRTETLRMDGGSSNDPDLDVTDIYLDEDDEVHFTVTNRGGDDVDNGTEVSIKVYVDGTSEYSKTVTQSSSTTNFLDEDEENTYSAGDILDDEGDSYEVEVCVDTGDDVDESSESNNCMTVDEDSIDNGSSESCGNFTDLDSHWSEEYVCALYDRDVVDGRTSTRFYPDSTTTRAEFLKMVLLDAELDPYSVSSVHFSDVSSSAWYYDYVTYAASKDYIDGYSNGTFKPNQAITRAEALVILMRVADQDMNYDESDIDFWDVDVDDWFASAVVIADQDNLVNGYSDDSFRPNNAITRGETAKILDLAYDEYFN